jgi:hypothetical protein
MHIPLRYSLRTLAILLTLNCACLGCGLGWFRHHRNWIQQRQACLNSVYGCGLKDQPNRSLRLLGEEGVRFIVIGNNASDPRPEYARALFPEVEEVYSPDSDGRP